LGQSKNMANGLKSSLGHTLSNTTWHMDKIQNGGRVGRHIGKKT